MQPKNKLIIRHFLSMYGIGFGMFAFAYFLCRFLNIELGTSFGEMFMYGGIFGTISFRV